MDLLAIAKNAADRVEAASVANKVPVAVCVIDVHGNVVLQHRMTGAPVFSIELSERKAYTSALGGMRTAAILPLVQPGQPLYPLSMVSAAALMSSRSLPRRFWRFRSSRNSFRCEIRRMRRRQSERVFLAHPAADSKVSTFLRAFASAMARFVSLFVTRSGKG